MLVVVDVGCHNHPRHQGASQDSIRQLVRRFSPARLYGFDPHPDMVPSSFMVDSTLVETQQVAASTHNGRLRYQQSGLGSSVGIGTDDVPCLDLAVWLERNTPQGCVLKMDVEGAEYDLLEHLLATGADRLVLRLLVQFHPVPGKWRTRRRQILRAWKGPVEEWD